MHYIRAKIILTDFSWVVSTLTVKPSNLRNPLRLYIALIEHREHEHNHDTMAFFLAHYKCNSQVWLFQTRLSEMESEF